MHDIYNFKLKYATTAEYKTYLKHEKLFILASFQNFFMKFNFNQLLYLYKSNIFINMIY